MKTILVVLLFCVACSSNEFSNDGVAGSSGSSSSATGGAAPTSTSGGSSSSATGGTAPASTLGGSNATGGHSTGGAPTSSIIRVLNLGSAGAATNPSIDTTVELDNVSGADIDLTAFRLRYWFTIDTTTATAVAVFGIGVQSETLSIGTVLPVRTGADHYIDLAFNGGSILTGASLTIDFGAHLSDWSAMNQLNDYSYPGDLALRAELTTVTVYRNGVLVAGVEP